MSSSVLNLAVVLVVLLGIWFAIVGQREKARRRRRRAGLRQAYLNQSRCPHCGHETGANIGHDAVCSACGRNRRVSLTEVRTMERVLEWPPEPTRSLFTIRVRGDGRYADRGSTATRHPA